MAIKTLLQIHEIRLFWTFVAKFVCNTPLHEDFISCPEFIIIGESYITISSHNQFAILIFFMYDANQDSYVKKLPQQNLYLKSTYL